jgi:hypothetical protein
MEKIFKSNEKVLGIDDNQSPEIQPSNAIDYGTEIIDFRTCFPDGTIGEGSDLIPKGSKIIDYKLVFEGKIDESRNRFVAVCIKSKEEFYSQRAKGILTLYSVKKGFPDTVIISVNAISGSGGSGCIPNSVYKKDRFIEYFVGKLVKDSGFNDGQINTNGVYDIEHAYKLYIYETFTNRGSFRIHPTRIDTIGEPMSNDGCISPFVISESTAFYFEISKILKSSKFIIPLIVNIIGNNNITRNIIIKKKILNEDKVLIDVEMPDPKYFYPNE